MKLICVIKDATGDVHATLSRGPDYYRRTLAAETGGTAHLIWCAVPPTGKPRKDVLNTAEAVCARHGTGALLTPALTWHFAVLPPIADAARRTQARLLRPLRRIWAYLQECA